MRTAWMSTRMEWSCLISTRRILKRSRLRRRCGAKPFATCATQIEITDDEGKTVLIVPFWEILDNLKGAPKAHPMQTAERAAKLSAEIKQPVSIAHERLRESQDLLAKLPSDRGPGGRDQSQEQGRARYDEGDRELTLP